MTLSHFILIILIICLFPPINLSADELYVLKNVKVHTEASLESPVTKLLLGGETVNILGIDGDFTEVEDTDEKVGWVASDFLTDIEPAKVISNKEVEKLTKNKVQSSNKKTTQVEKKSTKKVNSAIDSDKKYSNIKLSSDSSNESQQDITLQIENQHLQRQLEKIQLILNETPSTNNRDYDDSGKSKTSLINSFNFDTSNLSIWLALGGLIVGFIIGLLWSDFRQRRHHGGFKV